MILVRRTVIINGRIYPYLGAAAGQQLLANFGASIKLNESWHATFINQHI